MNGLARVALGASGLAAAALALLPALVAGLVALFDLSAHALLGTSGSLLGFAGALVPVGGGGGALPPYARIDIDPGRATLMSLARGVAPLAMVVFAVRPGPRALVVIAAGLALVTDGFAGAIVAAPGAVAAFALNAGSRTPRR